MAGNHYLSSLTFSSIGISQRARSSYIAFFRICRSYTTTCSRASSARFYRSDFANQPFTGTYEPGEKTSGPLGDASVIGAPILTPKILKQHLDQFVVGQERAKKVLSVAVYNHYQKIQEAQRLEEEEDALLQQRLRREATHGHPVQGKRSRSCSRKYLIERHQTNTLAINLLCPCTLLHPHLVPQHLSIHRP